MPSSFKAKILLLLAVAIMTAFWLRIGKDVVPYSAKVNQCDPALVQQMQNAIQGTVDGYHALLNSPKETQGPREKAAERFFEYANRVGPTGTGDDEYARTLAEPLVDGMLEELWQGHKAGLQELQKPGIDQRARELLAQNACFWNCAKSSLDYLQGFENELNLLPQIVRNLYESGMVLQEQIGQSLEPHYTAARTHGPLTLNEVRAMDAQLKSLRAQLDNADYGEMSDALSGKIDAISNKFSAMVAAETVKVYQVKQQEELTRIRNLQSALAATAKQVRATCAADAKKGIPPPPDSVAFLPQVLKK